MLSAFLIFVLGLVVSALINIITALFSRDRALRLLPWLLLYLLLHGSFALLDTFQVPMKLARQFPPSWSSYVVVAIIGGLLAMLYWRIAMIAAVSADKATRPSPSAAISPPESALPEAQPSEVAVANTTRPVQKSPPARSFTSVKPIHAKFISTIFWKADGDIFPIHPPNRLTRAMIVLKSSQYVNQAKIDNVLPKDVLHSSVDWLQFMIVHQMSEHFSINWSNKVEFVNGGGGTSVVVSGKATNPDEPRSLLSWQQVASVMRNNMYGSTTKLVPMQLALPPGTTMTVRPYTPGDPSVIEFNKVDAFDVKVLVTPLMGGGDLLSYDPVQFGLTPEDRVRVKADTIMVEIQANFELMEDEVAAREYEDWVKEIVKILRIGFADPDSGVS